jgi:predicted branched-subunit amino acid permease
MALGDRLAYFFGTAVPLWVIWQATTILGALVGEEIPDDIRLDFAIPLCFLVLLAPAVVDRPGVAAAVVGGVVAVAVAGTGLHEAATVIGAIAGIAAGVVVDLRRAEAR